MGLRKDNNMKKIIASLLVLVMIFCTLIFAPKETKAYDLDQRLTCKLNSIKIKWDKAKHAKYYELYRVRQKSFYGSPSLKKYKKIKTLKKRSYNDKNVKYNFYYGYYVKAKNSKGKTIGTTKMYANHFVQKGLEKPSLYDEIFEENNDHKAGKIYISVAQPTDSYRSKKIKYTFYRKMKGEKKFKKIKLSKTTYEWNEKRKEKCWVDKKVKGNKVYYYKAKAYLKKGKKTYRSKFSETTKIKAIETHAVYDFETLTPAGEYETTELPVIFKAKKTNRFTYKLFMNGSAEYIVCKKSDGVQHVYELSIAEYSYDNSVWKNVPENFELVFNKTVYFKGLIQSKDKIIFGGNDKKNYSQSLIDAEGGFMRLDLEKGYTSSFANLLFGYGSAYQEYD